MSIASRSDDPREEAVVITFIGVRTATGRVIHWYAGESFDGARHLPGGVACGLGRVWMPLFAVDRHGGRFGPRLDDYCARCEGAIAQKLLRRIA